MAVSDLMASQMRSAVLVHCTRSWSGGYSSVGTVMNSMLSVPTFWMLWATAVMLVRPNSGSVVSAFVAALRKEKSLSGRSRSEVEVAFCATEAMKACCRLIRPRSEPSPIVLRART